MTTLAYIVAFFWIFGFFPAASIYSERLKRNGYRLSEDLIAAAYLILYMIAGGAIVT